MSINRKSKPNDVVESSSDDDKPISTINTRSTECSSTPNSQCSICLDKLTNPCNTNSCLHSFCFECLQRWSNAARNCPLCRETFTSIYHSFNSLGVHKIYNVPMHFPYIRVRQDIPTINNRVDIQWSDWIPGPVTLFSDNTPISQILSDHNILEAPLTGNSGYDIQDYEQIYDQISNRMFTFHSLLTGRSETSVVNSVSEEVLMPNVSSSTNDSDVIQSHSFRSIEPLISASIDQPSTSTGIYRPNNSFQSVNGSSFPHPSHRRRNRPYQDSSSDDEDSIIATQGSKTAQINTRDISSKKKKKRKLNKKKETNTNDSGSEIPSTNRNRSSSESSSTSGETDTN